MNFGTEVRYTWGGEQILEEITSATSPTVNATWAWGGRRIPIRMNRGGTVSYYHANQVSSVEKLTSSGGTVAETCEFDAFGKPSLASSARGNIFLWHGRPYDFTSGLYLDRRM